MTELQVLPARKPLRGTLRVPGDKSISHRAVMLAAVAEGRSEIHGFLHGEDTLATVRACRHMGVSIEAGPRTVTVQGVGLRGLSPPPEPLDLGNSGTAARLLAGLLCGHPGMRCELAGDRSLQSRPMRRILRPLGEMGAKITAAAGDALPLRIDARPLRGIDWSGSVPSAQVKSAILLAGLYAQGETCVREPMPTRDHTERLLAHMGHAPETRDGKIRVTPARALQARDTHVPGDISSAAFFLVAAALVPGSDLLLPGVGVNPRRDAVLRILRGMGADLSLHELREVDGEPVADIQVRASDLRGMEIPPEWVPDAIDEFPAILIAAAAAQGETVVRGAEELRVKESDRIHAMATGLRALGIEAETREDGITVSGGKLQGGHVDAFGDHRVAMAFAAAGAGAAAEVRIRSCENIRTSFPDFAACARQAGWEAQEHA